MRKLSLKWQMVLAIAIGVFMFAVVLPLVDRATFWIPAFSKCGEQVDTSQISAICSQRKKVGALIILVLAVPWFIWLHAMAYPKKPDQAKPVKLLSLDHLNLPTLQKVTLPTAYGLSFGPIHPEGSPFALRIADQVFDVVGNGLFSRQLIVSGEIVYGIHRKIPLIKSACFLLAIYVPRTGVLYGVGQRIQLFSALSMSACALLSFYYFSDNAQSIGWFSILFVILSLAYLAIVFRAKKYLRIALNKQ